MLAEIETLEAAMRDLLAMLADPDPAGIDAAWKRCVEVGKELNTVLVQSSELSEGERRDVRTGLEALVRLNAITRQAVIHSQDALAKNLNVAKRNSEQVKAYGAKARTVGESCDLAG